MKALDFLVMLRDHGIQIRAEGDRLRCNAPAGVLTSDLRRELRLRKDEILNFLRSADALTQQPRAIVPLQSQGTKIPIIAVAGHNGDVFCFRALAAHLGADQPFYGLQPPGLDGSCEPLISVEELAAYFARQIRAALPNGPYIIVGYCAGGTIAFELARHLLEGAATVCCLALFGSPFPTWYRRLPQLRERLIQTIERMIRHSRALVSAAGERRAYLAGRLRNLQAERDAERIVAEDPVLVWRERVGRATLAAIRRYVTGPFSGRLILIWPNKGWRHCGNALAQWPVVSQDSEMHFGPEGCDGANMLREPYAGVFAELLRGSLKAMSNATLVLPGPSRTMTPVLNSEVIKAVSP